MIDVPIRKFFKDEEGASTVLGILWFMLFVGLGGLAVDITNGFRVQTMMQATADSAAHAGVIDLPDGNAAVTTAINYAERNMPPQSHGNVLVTNDVQVGLWEATSRTFTPGAAPPNAVRVILRSEAAGGNAIPVAFLRIVGLRHWDIAVSAIAAYSPTGDCFDYYGFIARGFVETGSENDYDGVCIHGEEYVKVGSQNDFDDATLVSMADLDDLVEGSDNAGLHPEHPEGALKQESYDPDLVDQVPDIIDGLASGDMTPPMSLANSNNPVVVSNLPGTLVEGTLYVVTGSDDVVIPSDAVVNDVGVVVLDSDAKLLVGSKVKLSNVLLAARGNIEVGSENEIGATDFCTTGQGAVFAFTESEYKAGSQTDYSGVQIVSMGDTFLGSELTSGGRTPDALTVQSGGNIHWGSQEHFQAGCQAPSFFSLDGRVAIVD